MSYSRKSLSKFLFSSCFDAEVKETEQEWEDKCCKSLRIVYWSCYHQYDIKKQLTSDLNRYYPDINKSRLEKLKLYFDNQLTQQLDLHNACLERLSSSDLRYSNSFYSARMYMHIDLNVSGKNRLDQLIRYAKSHLEFHIQSLLNIHTDPIVSASTETILERNYLRL